MTLILLLGVVASPATNAQASVSAEEPTNQLRCIEQPLSWKVSVTLVGLALIGLELWWFQFSKTKTQ